MRSTIEPAAADASAHPFVITLLALHLRLSFVESGADRALAAKILADGYDDVCDGGQDHDASDQQQRSNWHSSK